MRLFVEAATDPITHLLECRIIADFGPEFAKEEPLDCNAKQLAFCAYACGS
jgi:hypothetical protein